MECENEVEASLALQFMMANDAAQRSVAIMGSALLADQRTAMGNLANKFMRTSTAQVEALAKLRRGGEQVVKHVHVDNRNGGQTVIAENVQAGGAKKENADQSHGTNSIAGSPEMLSENTAGNGVPISGNAKREMPDSRRSKSRRTKGKSERA